MRNLVIFFVAALVFTLPWEGMVVLPEFGTLSRALGVAAFAVGIIAVAMTGRLRRPLLLHGFVVAFLVYGLLSMLWSPGSESILAKTWTFTQLLIFAWLIWEFFQTAFQQKLLLHAYIWGCIVAVITQFVNYDAVMANAVMGETLRLEGGGLNLNEYGILLGISIPLAIYFASDPKLFKWLRLAYWAYCPVCILSIFLTGSRTGFMITIIIVGSLGFMYAFKRPAYFVALTLAAVITVALIPTVIPEKTLGRMTGTVDELFSGTWGGRLAIYRIGFSVFAENALFGTGTGSFTYMSGGPDAHNTYLKLLVEVGSIGFLLFMGTLITTYIYAWKLPYREKITWLTILIGWSAGALVGSLEDRKLFWLLLGIIGCLYATYKKEIVEKDVPSRAIKGGYRPPPLLGFPLRNPKGG